MGHEGWDRRGTHGNPVSQEEGSHPDGKTNEAPEVWCEQHQQLVPYGAKKKKIPPLRNDKITAFNYARTDSFIPAYITQR